MFSFGAKPQEKEPMELATARLLLRPARFEDYLQWAEVRLANKCFLEPFEPSWPNDCLSEGFFRRRVDRLAADREAGKTYAFLILKDDRLIGGINLNNVARGAAQYASLGYWLEEKSQGQGYMSEATTSVIKFAFLNIFLSRINAATLVHNHKSRRMLTRLGFEEEGFARAYIQIEGRRQDHILYGLNAVDFLRAA